MRLVYIYLLHKAGLLKINEKVYLQLKLKICPTTKSFLCNQPLLFSLSLSLECKKQLHQNIKTKTPALNERFANYPPAKS